MTDRRVSSGQQGGESFLVCVSAELAGLVHSLLCEMLTERLKIGLFFPAPSLDRSPPPHILPLHMCRRPWVGVLECYLEKAFRTDQPINSGTRKGP